MQLLSIPANHFPLFDVTVADPVTQSTFINFLRISDLDDSAHILEGYLCLINDLHSRDAYLMDFISLIRMICDFQLITVEDLLILDFDRAAFLYDIELISHHMNMDRYFFIFRHMVFSFISLHWWTAIKLSCKIMERASDISGLAQEFMRVNGLSFDQICTEYYPNLTTVPVE